MQLTRCNAQSGRTLCETYELFAARGVESGVHGGAMLRFIEAVRDLDDPRRVWGLTSHAELVLLASDDAASPWFIRVFAYGERLYQVQYLMPAPHAPWPGATVQGEAESPHEAVELVLVAMQRSGGWEDYPGTP